ncbi:hypothetical protein [Arthrobacter sp. C9C5]|uniref:hypothetical protein n=1 Tax=Arthrobacter sp. C9C5 TaxID=2735267 RepID=UPI001585406A|nr:hypothetical protein [Arthrobacter sp. C9C5]NUU30838.1 hypothetical protein [Arthrobacter sp. C9C5]
MPVADLTNEIAAVIAAGGSVTSEYERLAQRWHDYIDADRTAADKLAAAFIGTEPLERVHELTGLALAELAGPKERATVRNDLDAQLYPILKNEYAKTAAANYDTLRGQFNATAAAFTKAAATADPDTDAGTLLQADAKTRTAWLDAAVHAQELTALVPVLAAAAKLAGARVITNDDHLPLTVNPGSAHRRRVWEAWASNGRAGRWAALAKLGATIHAPALDDIKPYRQPAPMQIKQVPVAYGIQQIPYDPEDADYKPQHVSDSAMVVHK